VVRTLALSLAIAFLAPAAGSAEEDEAFARTGFYAGVGGVIGVENFDNVKDDASRNLQRRPDCPDNLQATIRCVHRPLGPVQVDLNQTGGIDGWIGYRVHPYLAVEAQAEWMAMLGWKSDENMAGNGLARNLELDIDTLVLTANLKPYFLTGRIQPFALIGAGIMLEEFGVEYDGFNDDERHRDFAMRFGAGAEYYATDNVVLSLKGSYVLTFGTVADRDYISFGLLGLSYRF
jgi:opacity protein-like surface antigen